MGDCTVMGDEGEVNWVTGKLAKEANGSVCKQVDQDRQTGAGDT